MEKRQRLSPFRQRTILGRFTRPGILCISTLVCVLSLEVSAKFAEMRFDCTK